MSVRCSFFRVGVGGREIRLSDGIKTRFRYFSGGPCDGYAAARVALTKKGRDARGRAPQIVSGRSRCLYTGRQRVYFSKWRRYRLPDARPNRAAGHRLPPCRGVHACVREMAPVAQGVPALPSRPDRARSSSRCGTIVPPSYRIPQPFLPPTLGKNLSFRDEPDDYSFLRFFLEISRRSVARNEKQGSFSSSISLFLYTKYHTRDIVLARTREREREKERKRRGESWKGAGETVARRSRWTERCPACATGDEADLEEQSWRDPRAAALYRPRRPTTATKRARR